MKEILIVDRTLAYEDPFYCPTINGSLDGLRANDGTIVCGATIAEKLISGRINFIDLGFVCDKKHWFPVVNALSDEKHHAMGNAGMDSSCIKTYKTTVSPFETIDGQEINSPDSYEQKALPEPTEKSRYVVSVLFREDASLEKELATQLQKIDSTIVRVIFEQVHGKHVAEFCKKLVSQNITVWLHPLNIVDYSANEVEELLQLFKDIDLGAIFLSSEANIHSAYIVNHLLPVLNKSLSDTVYIGISSLGLEWCSFTKLKKIFSSFPKRKFVLDTVVYNKTDAHSLPLLCPTLSNIKNEPWDKIGEKSLLELFELLLPTMPQTKQTYENVAFVAGHETGTALYFFTHQIPIWEVYDFLRYYTSKQLTQLSLLELESSLVDFRRKKIAIALLVPVKDSSDEIRVLIDSVNDSLKNFGIDLIIHDSSEHDEIKKTVMQLNASNITYEKYIDRSNQKTIDHQVCDAIATYADKYKYIWPIGGALIPQIDIVYGIISLFVWWEYDFVTICPHAKEGTPRLAVFYDNPISLLRDLFGEITVLGAVLYSAPFVQAMLSRQPINSEENLGQWITIALFTYIAEHKFRAGYVAISPMLHLPAKTNKPLWWVWYLRWPTMVFNLPTIYDQEKKALIRCENWPVKPLDWQSLVLSRVTHGFHAKDVWEKRDQIRKIGKVSVWKPLLISVLPIGFLKNYQRMQERSSNTVQFIAKVKQSVSKRCKENWNSIKPAYRKKYSGKDYGEYEDCFARHEHIASYLLSGNLENIRHPLITIIIPAYKRLELLKETLQSVLCQTDVDFAWDIVIVDNEPYQGAKSETQKYIENLKNPRILYYRHQENLGADGNFNRGAKLARGKWISFVHDDDLLITRYLERIGKRIKVFENAAEKKLGLIWGTYHVFRGPELAKNPKLRQELALENYFICAKKDTGQMHRRTHGNLVFTGDLGIGAPTTGTLFRRSAYIEFGGIQSEAFNISSDVIFAHKLMTKYAAYSNASVLGFYRWHINASRSKVDQILSDLYDFREYAYSKSCLTRLIGFFVRQEAFIRQAKALWYQEHRTLAGFDLNNYSHIMELHENKLRRHFAKYVRKKFLKYKKKTKDVRFSRQMLETKDGR